MKMYMMKTYMAKKGEINRQWHHVDASGQVLGRLASRIATVLMGKHRPTYTRHVDTGDFVVVTNAPKVRITGRKLDQKEYQHYSGYPSGQKRTSLRRMLEKKPERVLREAVRRMLPKGVLGNAMLKKLKIYSGPDHPHEAQQPKKLTFAGKGLSG